MKQHTTNYHNTLILIAEDCPVKKPEMPQLKEGAPTIAAIQFELIYNNPYKFTSDDVVFEVHRLRNGISPEESTEARQKFFSKGQPCLRTSPLSKRYGWGIHHDTQGKIALIGCSTPEYGNLSNDSRISVIKAIRTKRI